MGLFQGTGRIELASWLLEVEKTRGNAATAVRFKDGDRDVTLSDPARTFSATNIVSVSAFGGAGTRLQRRQWHVTTSIRPGASLLTARNWRNAKATLWLYTEPGAEAVLFRTGWCKQRLVHHEEDAGWQETLTFGGLLDRATGTKKRYTNDKSHRKLSGASTDDAFALAQKKLDVNWGGN